jgi:hypothetical protein
MNIIKLYPRPSNPRFPRVVHDHQRAAIRDDVQVSTLVRALATHGLTLSNDPELGLVIRPMPPRGAA